MKSKGKTITLSVLAVVAVILVSFFAVVFISGNQLTVTRCVVNDNGTLYMIYNERPIHLSYGNETNFSTGDNLLIIHQSAFAESYPEQTRAYLIIKIGSGSESDIPQKAYDILIETGNWDK